MIAVNANCISLCLRSRSNRPVVGQLAGGVGMPPGSSPNGQAAISKFSLNIHRRIAAINRNLVHSRLERLSRQNDIDLLIPRCHQRKRRDAFEHRGGRFEARNWRLQAFARSALIEHYRSAGKVKAGERID